ncbi:glycosyltransferase family 2 protein [Candidatus Woesebacteria bacterium]|nr:glycosyltransferase family 2 protein [Candidatus Woesebacteria bacterium]
MPTITAVIHTKNSQRTLEACLASVNWCTEVFVIDMESTDDTVQIATKHKAKVFHVKGSHRFADPVRDEFLKKVKTDWTLIVDSDEEVPVTLATKIQEVMKLDEFDGHNLPRKNLIFGRWIEHTGFWPDYILRLFKTGKGSYPPYIHAQPKVEGAIHNLEANEDYALVHHHYESIEEFLLRLNVYTSLEAQKYHSLVQAKEVEPVQKFDFIQSFFDQFFTRFFAQQGYKDGKFGLVLSLLMAVYSMVVQMKIWEGVKEKDSALTLSDVELSVNQACTNTTYWVANEEMTQETNLLKKMQLKLRRKLSS